MSAAGDAPDAPPSAEAVFDHLGYRIIDARRMEHLATLGFELHHASVLELGAGAGGLTSFFINRDCQVTAVEGRAEPHALLTERFPSITALHLDIEAEGVVLPRREVVFAYGLLNHLSDPEAALARMATAAKRLLLLESFVSADEDEQLRRFAEDATIPALGLSGQACNPSRAWIVAQLKKRFAHVYLPKTQPNHPLFPLDWSRAPGRPNACRAVFVAAHAPLENPLLTESLPQKQARCP